MTEILTFSFPVTTAASVGKQMWFLSLAGHCLLGHF